MRELIADAHARLRRERLAFGHGTTNAWDEAVYLVLHALGLPLHKLTPVLARKVTLAETKRALRLLDQRIQRRIPAAYLTREAWLGNFRFYVDERVLVPRSFIAELLRARLAPWIMRPARIKRALDLCTGSGCLAIVLAQAFPAARIDATDISRAALAVARRNVAAYRLQRRVSLRESDMFSALRGARYDLIVANPPYLGASAMRGLPREYRHEPRLALASGRSGLDAVRVILCQAAAHLNDDGLLVVEVGHQRRKLESAFPDLPFIWPQTSAGDDCVFMLSRRDFVAAAATAPRRRVAVTTTRAGAGSRRR